MGSSSPILTLNMGCIHYAKDTQLQKTEISDTLLADLSRDLAEVNFLIENAKQEYKPEQMSVKVIEPWTHPSKEKFAISTPSGREEFAVKEKSKIAVPTQEGMKTTDVFKLMGKEGGFIGVIRPESVGVFTMAATKKLEVEGRPIIFYDPLIGTDQKAIEAISQYVSLTDKIEDASKRILEKLAYLKKKYEEMPIYIEGFSLHLPAISVTIQFKFKSK